MEQNMCSVYEKSSMDCIYVLALYGTIAFLVDYYRKYYKSINFEYDPDDDYGGVLCI